jgi:hypothetical protein
MLTPIQPLDLLCSLKGLSKLQPIVTTAITGSSRVCAEPDKLQAVHVHGARELSSCFEPSPTAAQRSCNQQ